MANILYGINGEGSGHWTRSREVISHLVSEGHSVTVATSGRALANLKGEFPVEEVFGFSFRFTKGRVDELRTFFKNIDVIPRGGSSVRKITGLMKDKDIELVITDFEPVSCLSGTLRRKPIISIDNQHFITRTDVEYPRRYVAQANVTKAAIEMMVPGADRYFALSFFGAEPISRKVSVVRPVLPRRILDAETSSGDYILVYLTHGSDEVAELLKYIRYRFVVYGSGSERTEGNVSFRKFDRDRFLHDLAFAGGVFATAGFSLIGEALYLGKPYLAWPVANQFEQLFNAYHIERLGYGKCVHRPTREGIESFLFNLDRYREALAGYPRGNNDEMFAELDRTIKKLI